MINLMWPQSSPELTDQVIRGKQTLVYIVKNLKKHLTQIPHAQHLYRWQATTITCPNYDLCPGILAAQQSGKEEMWFYVVSPIYLLIFYIRRGRFIKKTFRAR